MSNAANFEAALAIASGAPAETSAPTPAAAPAAAPTEAPAPTPPVETPSEQSQAAAPSPKPVDADTLERLRQRQRAKQQNRPPQTDDTELAEFRAWRAAQTQRAPGIDPQRLKSDPVKALEDAGLDVEATLNALTKHSVTPDVAGLEARLEAKFGAILEENKSLRSQIEQIRDDRQARDRSKSTQRAREAFQSHTSDKAKYPNLAKLSDERRAQRGARKAQELIDEGIEDFSLEEVAQLVESDLHSELSELLGRDPNEPAPSDAESTAPAEAQGRNKRPSTITSSAASSSAASPRKLTEQERFAAALAVASRGP